MRLAMGLVVITHRPKSVADEHGTAYVLSWRAWAASTPTPTEPTTTPHPTLNQSSSMKAAAATQIPSPRTVMLRFDMAPR